MARQIKALEKYNELKSEIAETKDRIAALDSIVQRSTPNYSISGGTGGAGSSREDIQLEAIMLQANLDKKVLQLEHSRQQLEEFIDRLTVNEQRVIKAKYMTGKKTSWTSVSMNVHFSRSQCFEYHKKAIDKLWRWGLR